MSNRYIRMNESNFSSVRWRQVPSLVMHSRMGECRLGGWQVERNTSSIRYLPSRNGGHTGTFSSWDVEIGRTFWTNCLHLRRGVWFILKCKTLMQLKVTLMLCLLDDVYVQFCRHHGSQVRCGSGELEVDCLLRYGPSRRRSRGAFSSLFEVSVWHLIGWLPVTERRERERNWYENPFTKWRWRLCLCVHLASHDGWEERGRGERGGGEGRGEEGERERERAQITIQNLKRTIEILHTSIAHPLSMQRR